MVLTPVSCDAWCMNCCGVDGRQAYIQWNSTCFAPSPGKQTGMNLLDFLILPVRVIGCSLAALPQAGWRSSNILVDTSHMSIRSQKKCRNMFEGVDIVDIWFLCQVVRNCVAACLRGVSPQLGKFSGLQTRRKCITWNYMYCLIINNVSFMYGDLWKLWVSQNAALTNSTNSYKLYLSSRGGTSNAFKVFCSELTDLCRCNGLTVLAQALCEAAKLCKNIHLRSRLPVRSREWFCTSVLALWVGFPHAVPCVCILLGFWTGWGDIGREINDGHWNRNQWCQ